MKERLLGVRNRAGLWPRMLVGAAVAFALLFATAGGTESYSDIRADWIVVKAASNGLDPGAGLVELAKQLEVEYVPVSEDQVTTVDRVHPRTPGALLLLLPLAAVPADAVFEVSLLVNALLGMLLLAWIVPETMRPPSDGWILVAVLAALGFPFLRALGFGTHSVAMACLLGWATVILARRDSMVGGLLVGIAGVLRLFPLGIVVALLVARRWRAAASAIGVFGTLMVLGSFVFGVAPAEAFRVLAIANDQWGATTVNGSAGAWLRWLGWTPETVGAVLVGIAVVVSIVWSCQTRRDVPLMIGGTLLIWLLASPVSWSHYDVVMVPLVAAVLSQASYPRPSRWLVWVYLGGWALVPWIILFWGVELSTSLTVAMRTVLTGGVLLAGVAWRIRPEATERLFARTGPT